MAPQLILVGSRDRQLEQLMRACGMTDAPVPRTELAALAHPSARQPDVIVIDLRDDTEVPAGVPVLKRQHPTTAIVIITARLDPALILAAMRAGVTECLTDPVTLADLRAAIDRALAQHRPSEAPRKVFAFIGAKGGVGATTLAVNVAAAVGLAKTASLVIDLHLASGDCAVFLGAEPRFSVLDALENVRRLDEAYLRGIITSTKTGVDLLAAPDRSPLVPIDPKAVRALVECAARQYGSVVLDVPRSDPAIVDALDVATRIVLVTTQELASVRTASRLASTIRQRYGKEKLLTVVTRSDRLAELSSEDIERAVGGPVRHVFPSAYRVALQALNHGRPLALDNHNALASALRQFAGELTGLEHTPKEKAGGGFLSRLTGRH